MFAYWQSCNLNTDSKNKQVEYLTFFPFSKSFKQIEQESSLVDRVFRKMIRGISLLRSSDNLNYLLRNCGRPWLTQEDERAVRPTFDMAEFFAMKILVDCRARPSSKTSYSRIKWIKKMRNSYFSVCEMMK